MKRSVALGIASVVKTFSSFKEDHIKIWKEIKKSFAVEKLLGEKEHADELIQDVIRAYNLATTKEGRILALTLLVNTFSFKQLCAFNPKDHREGKIVNSDSSDSENHTMSELEEDDEVDETGEQIKMNQKEKEVTFNPPLNWYYYQAARLHYRANQAALQPLICPPKSIWRIPFDTLRVVIDFATSEEVRNILITL